MIRRALFLTVVLFALASSAFCQGARYDNTATVNVFGVQHVVANATIRVCSSGSTGSPCSPLASIYSDVALTVPLVNPFNADANGNYHFFASSTVAYDIQVSGTGVATITQTNVTLSCPSGCSGLSSNNAFTGNNTHSGTETFNTNAIVANAGITSAGPNALNGGGTTAGAWTHAGLHTFNAGLTSSGPNTLNGGGVFSGTYSGNHTLTGTAIFKNINNQAVVTSGNPQSWAGSNEGAWINSAIASLGGNTGIVDARGLGSTGTISATIAVPAATTLLLGPTTFTCTIRPCISFLSYDHIEGINYTGVCVAGNGTTILINDGTAGAIIGPGSTGNINFVLLEKICLNGTTVVAGQVGLDFTNVSNSVTRNLNCNALTTCSLTTIAAPGTSAFYNEHYSMEDQGSTTDIVVNNGANSNRWFGGKSNASANCANIGASGSQTNDVEIFGFACEVYTANGFTFGPNSNGVLVVGGRLESAVGTGIVNTATNFGNSIYNLYRAGVGGNATSDTGASLTIFSPQTSFVQIGGNTASTFTLLSGGNFVAGHYDSQTANPATTGLFRLASTDLLTWRNNANSANLSVAKNSGDQINLLAFSGVFLNPLFLSGTNNPGVGDIRFASGQTMAWRNNANSADLTFAKNTSDNITWPNAIIAGGGSFSNSGAACTNGELGLSAGWQSTGAATVTAVAGISQTCSWTITTGTTTAANPTITDTLLNALPAATVVCEMNIHGGTHTAVAGEYFLQTGLSATAPVFTFQGTPTAGGTTYFVTRRCGP